MTTPAQKQLARARKEAQRRGLAASLESCLTSLGLRFEREVRFHPIRLWRFDYAIRDYGIAIEIDGGQFAYTKGKSSGHASVRGVNNDREKDIHAQLCGWLVLRFTTSQVRNTNYTFTMIREAVCYRMNSGPWRVADAGVR